METKWKASLKSASPLCLCTCTVLSYPSFPCRLVGIFFTYLGLLGPVQSSSGLTAELAALEAREHPPWLLVPKQEREQTSPSPVRTSSLV